MAAIVREGERRAIHTIDGHRTIRHWVRAQINCPMPEATRLRRLAIACDTTAELGDTLMNGHIGIAQADELARLATHPRVADQYGTVAPQLLRHAEHLSYEEFRIVTRRFETLADLDGAERDDEVSHEHRSATVIELDGALDVRVTGGSAMVAAELVGIFQQFLEAEFDADVAARTAEFGPDAPASLLPRTDAQRRFDAFTAIFRAAPSHPPTVSHRALSSTCSSDSSTYQRLIERQLTGLDPGIRSTSTCTSNASRPPPASPSHPPTCSLPASSPRSAESSSTLPVSSSTPAANDDSSPDPPETWHCSCHTAAGTPDAPCPPTAATSTTSPNGNETTAEPTKPTVLPRCSTHNPWKTANRIRSKRNQPATSSTSAPTAPP